MAPRASPFVSRYRASAVPCSRASRVGHACGRSSAEHAELMDRRLPAVASLVEHEWDRPAQFSAECSVGRLVEARLSWVNDADDVRHFLERMQVAFKIAGDSVICADWRQAMVLPPSASDALLGLLRQGNRHFVRSAILLAPENAVFSLQVERLCREAGNPARRTFREVEPFRAWLGEVLTPAESARAAEFIRHGSR